MRPALKLYEQRCYLWRLTCRLPLRDLIRLNFLLGKLSDDDLRQVAAFAEGLAEWADLAQSCSGDETDRTPSGATQEGSPAASADHGPGARSMG